jgi:S1-C subfamily serine protease
MKRVKDVRGLAVAAGVFALLAIAAAGVFDAHAGSKKKGKDAGYIGVYMQDLTEDVRKGLDLDVEKGVLVSGVVDDGPAEEAGIEDGDVIIALNGTEVSSPDELRDLVRDLAPGTEVEIKLVRDGEEKTVTLEVGDRAGRFWFSMDDTHHWPRNVQFARLFGGPRLGVDVCDLNDGLAGYFDTKAGSGVLVLDVDEESVASEAGVKAGDVIQKVGDDEVTSVDELRASLRDREAGDEVAITVLRKGKTEELVATMDEDTAFEWSGRMPNMRFGRHHFREPRIHMERLNDDLREEMDQLRKELDELRKEIRDKS